MDNVKNNEYYIKKIKKDIDYITFHMEHVNKTDFDNNEILQDAMMFRLIQISENASQITSDFKASAPRIPWKDITGLRNRIVHDYGNVELGIVFSTLKNDIPKLKALL